MQKCSRVELERPLQRVWKTINSEARVDYWAENGFWPSTKQEEKNRPLPRAYPQPALARKKSTASLRRRKRSDASQHQRNSLDPNTERPINCENKYTRDTRPE